MDIHVECAVLYLERHWQGIIVKVCIGFYVCLFFVGVSILTTSNLLKFYSLTMNAIIHLNFCSFVQKYIEA